MKTWFHNSLELTNGDIFCQLGEQLQITYMEKDEVKEFINGLYALDGVPVAALVADGQMLPPEALRYFYLDENWMDAMVDGAYSIGRSCSFDSRHDRMVLPKMKQMGRLDSFNRRSLRYGKGAINSSGEEDRTGFLLHSQLVEGWPGIEISCHSKERELNIMKLSHIGTSILFCMTDGIIDKITLTEPMESLYFGFEEEKGELAKRLVSLKEGEVGQDINLPIPLSFRSRETGLLNIKAFAKDMEQALKDVGKGSAYFSAPEFALQMVHERTCCTIEIERKNSDSAGGGDHV